MSEKPGRVTVAKTPEDVALTAARLIAGIINNSIEQFGECKIALSGGNTPRATYEKLADEPYKSGISWNKVEFYWGDERCVPPDDKNSNYSMAWGSLLTKLDIAESEVHRIKGENPDRENTADEYNRLFPDVLDLLLLGIGVDGHIASIFPGSSALQEKTRKVIAVIANKPPIHRITITPLVIEKAREIILIATGIEKAEAVAKALAGDCDPSILPACMARRGMWVLDAEAASMLHLPRNQNPKI